MKKLLFILILFLCSPSIVCAKDYDDSFYVAEYISNMYVNKVKNGVIHYKQARFIRSKKDKGIAYCIEPFETLSENIKYESYDAEQYKELGITKEKWNKISLIAYYGYGYGKHTTDKWYYVTQVMIWRVIDTDADFYFTDKLNGKKISSYNDEINEINKLVKDHTVLPSFANKSYTYSINQEIILNDTNKVLDSFQMTNNTDIQVKKGKDNLRIYSTNKANVKINFTKKTDKYDRPTIAFIDSKAQNIITPGNFENMNFQIEIKIKSGKIKINKLDFDTEKKEPSGSGTLIGTEYNVYNSNNEIVDTLIIDENYQATSKELPFDTYIIKESKNMEGYILDTQEYLVEINESNLIHELNLKNRAIKSKIQIYKYYEDKLEEGISFEIYDSNSKLVDIVTTDEFGKIEKDLYYGKYIFHQVNTTKNYLKVEDFEVVIDKDSSPVITLELYDEKFSSKLIILKKDSETGEIIKDEVIYNIYDLNNEKYITLNDTKDLKATNGILIIDKLEAGKYIVEEKKAPEGYIKTDRKIELVIDDENEFEYDDNNYPIYEITISNDREIIEIEVPNTHQDYEYEIVLFYERKKERTQRLH